MVPNEAIKFSWTPSLTPPSIDMLVTTTKTTTWKTGHTYTIYNTYIGEIGTTYTGGLAER